MNDINLIDSCQAHLHVQYASNKTAAKLTCLCNALRTSNSFPRSDTGVVIESEPHLSLTCKTRLLFAPFNGCQCSHWLFCFSVLHPNKTINTITY